MQTHFFRQFTSFMVLCALPFLSLAQDWPAKPVRIVVPYPAGGGVDAAARLVAQHLSTALSQSVVVDPKPGGGTVIGAEIGFSCTARWLYLFAHWRLHHVIVASDPYG